MLGDRVQNDADFGVVGHVDGGSAHARNLPAVEPLSGKVALLKGELERGFDDDGLIADGALRELTVLKQEQVVFGVLRQHLPDKIHAACRAPLCPGMQATPVGAKGCGSDALDAACAQKVPMQLGECDACRRAGRGGADEGPAGRAGL